MYSKGKGHVVVSFILMASLDPDSPLTILAPLGMIKLIFFLIKQKKTL